MTLPTELDGALSVPPVVGDPAADKDTVNVFNDGAVAAQQGSLSAISATEATALGTIYDVANKTITPAERPEAQQTFQKCVGIYKKIAAECTD